MLDALINDVPVTTAAAAAASMVTLSFLIMSRAEYLDTKNYLKTEEKQELLHLT